MGKPVASIALYGNREVGFAFLAHCATVEGVFGNYNPAGKMPNEDATSALFAACDALTARGVMGTARVTFDMKVNGVTVTRWADVSISSPPWFGNLRWTEVRHEA